MPTSPLTSKSSENKKNESGQVESVGQNSEACQPSQQPSDPIELVLLWSTRDCIMNCFNEFSFLLLGATSSNDLNEKMHQKTNDLVNRLTALHPVASSDTQNDDQKDNDQRPRKKRRVGESGESKPVTSQQPFFEIPFRLRNEVVDQLFCNLKAIMDDSDGSDEERKRIADRIANQNVRLNIQLLSLPPKVTNSHAPDESDHPFEDEPQPGKARA